MKKTIKDLTSVKIHNRRIYGENPAPYASSECANILAGQGEKIYFMPDSGDTASSPYHAERIMPVVADENIYAQFYNGDAADTGVTGQDDASISAKSAAACKKTPDGHLLDDDGWAQYNTTSPAWDAAHSPDGSSGGVRWTTSLGLNEGITSDTWTSSTGDCLTLEVTIWTSTAMQINFQTVRPGGIGTDLNTNIMSTGGWQDLTFHFTSQSSGSSAILRIYSGSDNADDQVKVASMMVYHFEQETDFELSDDPGFALGDNGAGIGAYYAIVPSTSTKPWEIDFDTLTLWEDYYIGCLTDFTGGTVPVAEVQVGLVPPLGDHVAGLNGYYAHDTSKTGDLKSRPYGGISAKSISAGSVFYFYEVAWWIKKAGIIGIRSRNDNINLMAHQYDDVPGGVTTDSVAVDAGGPINTIYQTSGASTNIHNISIGTGAAIDGNFKAVRLTMTTNATGGLPHATCELLCAPEDS